MDLTFESLSQHPNLIPVVAEWIHGQWGYVGERTSLPKLIKKYNQELNKKEVPFTLVAFNEGLPVGSGTIEPNDMGLKTDLDPWLKGLFVLPEYRKCGIASEIVREQCKIAKSIGLKKLYIVTVSQSNFYLKLGWQFLEHTTYAGKEAEILSFDLMAI